MYNIASRAIVWCGRRFMMLGYILYGDGPRRPELGERQLPGGAFVTLRIGQAAHPMGPLALSRARQGARRLREAGVRTAVFPVDFPYTALFIRQGVCPVDTLPLRRALAAPMTKRGLERLGLEPTQAVVAVTGERCARELDELTFADERAEQLRGGVEAEGLQPAVLKLDVRERK